MSRKFSVGDRVRVNCPTSPCGYHGQETVVVAIVPNAFLDGEIVALAYEVDLPPALEGYGWVGYEPHELIPIYDGDEPASWADCAWKPAGVSA